MKSLIEQFADNIFLVTTDNWFYAPDGKQYKSVWGKIECHTAEQTLGIKPNGKSANWYAIVGEGNKRVVLAGCQIHYACVCMDKPSLDEYIEKRPGDAAGVQYDYTQQPMIYFAQ